MRQGARYLWLAAGSALLAAVGCGSPDSSGPAAQGPAETVTNDHSPPFASVGAAGSMVPQDPVTAVKTTLTAVEEGRLDQAYDFLPNSYQQDVDTLIQTFARKMDPDLWKGMVSVLEKTAEVLSTKQKFVMPVVQQFAPGGPGNDPQAERKLAENWDSLVQALELLVQSDLGDLERLKRASSRQFLGTTGRRVFALLQPLDAAGANQLSELGQVSVTLAGNDGEYPVVVQIQGPNDATPTEHEFVRVDGHWIPKSLAEQWPKSIRALQDQLDRMTPGQFAVQKPKALEHLKAIELTLDDMLEAQKQEDFTAALLGLPGHLYGLQQTLVFKSAPPGSVVITIDRELSDAEQTQLLDELTQLTDKPERAQYTATTSGGRTRVSIDQVQDVAAFAERLTFAQKKTVDASARSIHLELKSE